MKTSSGVLVVIGQIMDRRTVKDETAALYMGSYFEDCDIHLPPQCFQGCRFLACRFHWPPGALPVPPHEKDGNKVMQR